MDSNDLAPQPHGGALSRVGVPGRSNYRKGKLYRRAMLRHIDADPEVINRITARELKDAEAGDTRAREHVRKVLDEITDATTVNVNIAILTPQMLQQFSPDELAGFRQCLPALQRVGVARPVRPGDSPEGGAGETGSGVIDS